MTKKLILSLLVMITLLGLSGCRGSVSMGPGSMEAHHQQMHGAVTSRSVEPPAEPNQVLIEDFAFAPASIHIQKGTAVVWTNRDLAPHTVTFEPFASGLLSQNQSWSYTFTEAGTYSYYCEPHPWMTGQVIVVEEE
jgi:plastocyanin